MICRAWTAGLGIKLAQLVPCDKACVTVPVIRDPPTLTQGHGVHGCAGDPQLPERFLVASSQGVHAVSLPWLPLLARHLTHPQGRP